jgi:hypothetical protein
MPVTASQVATASSNIHRHAIYYPGYDRRIVAPVIVAR